MALPKWIRRKSPQDEGRRYEKKLAKKIGGRVQPASGATPFYKEDISSDIWLVQVKTTTKDSYTLKIKDLETLRTNALKVGKIPLMVLRLGDREYNIMERG